MAVIAGRGNDEDGPTACASAAAPARVTLIDRESVRQKSYDLERHGRGGRLHALVRPRSGITASIRHDRCELRSRLALLPSKSVLLGLVEAVHTLRTLYLYAPQLLHFP
jgi:hypothetical protein